MIICTWYVKYNIRNQIRKKNLHVVNPVFFRQNKHPIINYYKIRTLPSNIMLSFPASFPSSFSCQYSVVRDWLDRLLMMVPDTFLKNLLPTLCGSPQSLERKLVLPPILYDCIPNNNKKKYKNCLYCLFFYMMIFPCFFFSKCLIYYLPLSRCWDLMMIPGLYFQQLLQTCLGTQIRREQQIFVRCFPTILQVMTIWSVVSDYPLTRKANLQMLFRQVMITIIWKQIKIRYIFRKIHKVSHGCYSNPNNTVDQLTLIKLLVTVVSKNSASK